MAIHIDTPVQYIKGVGPKLGQLFSQRGVHTVSELLAWYPRAYEDRRVARSISSLEANQLVSISAQVLKIRSMNMGRSHRKMYEIIISDKTGRIACKFFRVPYRGYFERFEVGQTVRVIGKVTHYRGVLEFHHPELHPEVENAVAEDILVPIYTETEGLSPQKLRKIIDASLKGLKETAVEEKSKITKWNSPKGIPDTLPRWVREKYKLLERSEALEQIHQPPFQESDLYLHFKSPAQKRIIFDEFFWLELHLASRRAGVEKEQSVALKCVGAWAEKLKKSLPFTLTKAQLRASDEIVKDLRKSHPMHRLIQGDVGSGKTLVAFLSALYTAECGHQTAIMVPTEILAEQHFANAKKLLAPLGVEVGLLTGHSKKAEREQILQSLVSGQIQIIIGTHALLEDEVNFSSLGLVVIDEQHRFGVHQRTKLKAKGLSPHFLVMTATPIPRTLAMTVYGDLDVSVIDEMPQGRLPIVTRKVFQSKRQKVLDFMRAQVEQGRQAYIVYPLVEESEKIDLKNAQEEFEKLKLQYPRLRFGLLHGRMKAQEKDAVMNQFRNKELDVLVSTTVIEVGVDVANANLMIIEHAERFGLSQLHQLRGRVGRGPYKSYCVLMLGHAISEDGIKRAEIMESTLDGFKIAEADLDMRGPGEFLGTKQSGLPGFRLANLVRDQVILQDARQAAFELIRKDPELADSAHQSVRQELEKNRLSIVG